MADTDQTLRAHGLNGDRLLKLARRCATDAQRKAPAGLGGKYEDLVSFLTLQALEAVARYNPERVKPGYSLSSYLYDVMQLRVTDFYRRKSEGFGDRRSGNDNRITLAGHTIDDQPTPEWEHQLEQTDPAHAIWSHAAGLISTPMHDWDLVNEAAVMRWTRAAQARGDRLDQWIRRTLDIAADHQLSPDKQAA